jgi:hypothetical protein
MRKLNARYTDTYKSIKGRQSGSEEALAAPERDTYPRAGKDRPNMSAKDRLISTQVNLIHKLKAKDTTGRWAYYFVLVNRSREAAFFESIRGDGMIDLEDFGKILASCYGEEPTEEVKTFLYEKYGFRV